jgi:hypothetical protein
MSKKSTAAATDTETRATSEHAPDLRLWLRTLACTNLIENHIRTRLRADFGITLPRFDLMAQLERSPQGLKMGELSKRMMVTGGNVTGITDQLVAEGLVVREDSPRDRRAYIVKLTPRVVAASGRWPKPMSNGSSTCSPGWTRSSADNFTSCLPS